MAQNSILSAPYRMTDLSKPGSIFGTNNPYSTPPIAGEPFQWGAGGARLTPDQLALRQQQATANQQTDFSPVQSVWQGIGRVANNAIGAFQQKGLDKEAAAQAADGKASIAALLGGGDGQTSAVAAALSGTDPVAQKLAMEIYKQQHPAAQAPNDFQQYLMGAGIQPGTPEWSQQNLARANSLSDPVVNITLPSGVFAGPRSMLPSTQAQAPTTKKLPNGQTAYFVNGDWYDNPEGR